LLKCSETKKSKEECVNSNWLNINEDLAYRKIISCTNVNKIKFLGKYSYLSKTKCNWEKKVRQGHNPPPPRVVGSQNIECEIGLRV
jgi:HKD family nuclease